MEQPARRRLIDVELVTECGQHVMDETTRAIDVARIVGDDPWHTVTFGQLDQCAGKRGLGATGVVELYFDGEVVGAEDVTPVAQQLSCASFVAVAEERSEWTGCGTGERVKSLGMRGNLRPGDARATAMRVLHRLGPLRPLSDARGSHARELQ